ncbi:MAG: YaiI/YqxD family protein [Planctomycetota bacterium]|nr:YaiI/YqxD family protein [Planctomycetota bacterium]
MSKVRIWVDADACPRTIKEFLFKTSKRLSVQLILVANQTVSAPESDRIQVVTVPYGADKADDRIVSRLQAGDIVITGDIPLAARAVEKECLAIGVRGEMYDESSIGNRLATRNLMDELRSAGMETKGPKAFDDRDFQRFANLLDRTLTRRLRQDR